jgi:hypothetical protein
VEVLGEAEPVGDEEHLDARVQQGGRVDLRRGEVSGQGPDRAAVDGGRVQQPCDHRHDLAQVQVPRERAIRGDIPGRLRSSGQQSRASE